MCHNFGIAFFSFLFWTNMGKTQKIERAHLDGTTKTTLFSTGLSSLGPITVDTPTRKVFWADLDLKRIECSDFDGGNRQNLVDEDIGEPSGLAVYGKYLYWVDRFTGSLERVDKSTGRNRVKILSRAAPMTDVVVVTLNKSDLKKSPCSHSNSGCSHLCVVIKNSGSRCSCPIGLQLASNERICEDPPSCKPDQFTCASGMCIPELWRCDGIPECEDHSDELNCSRCLPTQFHCDNGQCVMRKFRCDGKRNCQDESDERNCPPCENGTNECVEDRVCISASKWCDGRPDCADKSDETRCNAPMVDDHPHPAPSMPYAIGIGIVGAVVILVVFLVLVVCLCRQKSRTVTVVEDRDNIVMVAKPSNLSSSQRCDSSPRVVSPASCYSQTSLPSIARTISGFGSGDSESILYDRNHITGASSSSSAITHYPQETLNPPPSPITERSQSIALNPYYATGASKRPSKSHAARLYKRRRKHIPPPPTTPCSTDVCEDSEPYSCRNGHCHFGAEYGYESDLLCPPPPTPRSHYLSDDQDTSCPPSPSTEQSFFLPYPPPPPASVFSCSDS